MTMQKGNLLVSDLKQRKQSNSMHIDPNYTDDVDRSNYEYPIGPFQYEFVMTPRTKKRTDDYFKALEEYHDNNYGHELYLLKKFKLTEENKKVGQYIHDNYDNMDLKQRKDYLFEHIDPMEVNKLLLKMELDTWFPKPVKSMSKEEFIDQFNLLMKRYQCKAGGYYLNEFMWKVRDTDFRETIVEDDEFYLQNTIDTRQAKHFDTVFFLTKIAQKLSLLADNIKCEYVPEKSDRDHTWTMIKVIILANNIE